MRSYQRLLGDTNPPSKVLDIAVSEHDSRRELDAEHLMNREDDTFCVFAVSLDQAAKALVDIVGRDFWVSVETVSDNWQKGVFDGRANEPVRIDSPNFFLESGDADFEGS